MEIKITQKDTRVFVPINIISPELGYRTIPINFLADTGADRTTISPRDASNNEIDFSKLEKEKNPSMGIGGVQHCEYRIRDVELRFRGVNGDLITGKLDFIDVIEPDRKEESDSYMSEIPSLLGTDMSEVENVLPKQVFCA